jgi:hypothetical protein
MWVCELTHKLPYNQEERLQFLFIEIFGYHCPFATWAFQIDEKYGFDKWSVR